MEYNLESLNPAQLEAVKCCDAPSLVIAGAGSGKTRVLTTKIAYLMQNGMAPWNILALTFTNKAAREMRERIGKLVGDEQSSKLWMGTFHSIFSRILRIEADRLGFTSDFTIYDTSDSQSLIHSIVKEMGLDDKKYVKGSVAHYISEAKNNLMFPSDYLNDYEYRRRDEGMRMPQLGHIYEEYQDRLKKSNAMDFDDLLLYTWYLFRENEEVRADYEARFRYVLVDEYQDTNYAQHQIVWQLTQNNQKICVVGDDAQSIYSFRGARIANILSFQKQYKDAKLFKLEQNYRSTQIIVQAANSLISHNRQQIHKDVFSEKEEGDKIDVLEAYSDKEEACMVARKINTMKLRDHYDCSDIAVLYRTNSQSRVIEEELRRQGIPYMVYSGTSFYQRAEIKNVLAYLRLSINPDDEEALRRIINYPARGIGQTTVDKVFGAALTHNVSPWEIILHSENYELPVNAGTLKKLKDFANMITDIQNQSAINDAHTVAMEVVSRSGMADDIKQVHDPKDVERQQNVQELLDGIASFVSDAQEEGKDAKLRDYLQEVSLVSDLDKEASDEAPRVSLMTIHAAKGLEFKAVFVVGMEQELFPSSMSMDTNLEEERRLCYVAMTRAEERLVLSWSHSRFRFGRYENNQKSQFLREIDSKYLGTSGKSGINLLGERPKPQPIVSHPVSEQPIKRMRAVSSVSSSFTSQAPLPKDVPQIHVGSRIEHQRFGRGEVISLEGSGLDTKATVKFAEIGTKVLLIRFAKFTVVS